MNPATASRTGSDGKRPNVRRDEILAVARDVFYEHGYQKASMRQIAKRVRLTQAALYYHFASKEDILFAILERFADNLLNALVACLSQGEGPRGRLAGLITTQIGFIRTRRKDLKILVDESSNVGKQRSALIRGKQRMILDIYRSCLKDLVARGHMPDVDITTTAFAVLGIINWVNHWYKEDGRSTLDEIGHHVVDQVFFGLFGARPKTVKWLDGERIAGS